MPFTHATLRELIDGAIQDVVASRIYDATTNQVVNPLLLQFDPLTIMATVLAGLTYQVIEYADYIALQTNPATATDESALQWGALKGVTPKAATAATGTATFTSLANVAVDLPAGTQLVRSDGLAYVTTADVVYAAGATATVPFAATTTGAETTIAAGATISLASPPAGMQQDGTVTASTAPGSDLETEDDFKSRYLLEYNEPAQGGAASDYVEWALQVPGVTRAWTNPLCMGPGTVGVFFMLDQSEANTGGFPVGSNGVSPLDNNGAPRDVVATGDQLTLVNYLIPLQPVTALVYGVAPVPMPIAFSFTNLGASNTATNQAAIQAALTSLFLAIGTPLGMTVQLPTLIGAVLGTGVASFAMPAPAAAVVVPVGSLPTLGAVTFAT